MVKIKELDCGIRVAMDKMPEVQSVSLGIWVHGGGFAGTIQAFVKKETTAKYIETMESAFGQGCCYTLRIRDCGGIRIA